MISVKKELLPAIALSCILLGCSSKNTPAEITTNSMATDIYNSGLSNEEYFGVPGGDYE